ncbi:tetratricopeptide repeat protein [Paraclostridium dentum]|uniref:tetratricopeptide repeat protein n=1 Tax=Paraclostridium dentum TaxID=2662455 RepID=UPI003B006FAE
MDKFLTSIDNFTICLGEYSDDEQNALFWLQLLISKVKGKVYVVNFTGENVKSFIYKCRERWNEDSFISRDIFDKKVIFEENLSCSMRFVYGYINSASKDDYILIIGGERLLPYNNQGKKLINTKFEGLTIMANLMQEEDWHTYCLWLDKLYEDFQHKVKGIILNIGVDENTRDIITSLLEKSENMSIINTQYIKTNNNLYDISNEFYNNLEKYKYDDMIEFLDKNKNLLDKKTYIIMSIQVYLFFGVRNKAINLLEKNYDYLSNQNKKLLADLLYREYNKVDESKKILYEIFKQDKFLKDLMPSILRVHEKDSDEIREKWINISLEIDPDNPKVIENYGNWLSHINKYEEAAKIFRNLKLIFNNQYYEIVARINDILNNPPQDLLEIQTYILQSVQDYPELHNEAILRLVIYFKDINRSEYVTYRLLNDIDYNFNEDLVYKLLNIKLDMLSDIVTASKALGKLKPHIKDTHAKKINIERIKCVINSIFTLAKYEKGYLDWRRFIDNCQSQDSWFDVVCDELIENICELNKLDINKLIGNSFINRIEDCNNKGYKELGIVLLRKIKSGQFHVDDIDETITNLLKYAEIEQDEELKIWGRYYASIIYSLRGNDQLANNYALTILDYYNIMSEERKEICILLGLISWANSQFRIGREIEGIICLITCIKYCSNVGEIYPILEEGLNLVGRFFTEHINGIQSMDNSRVSSVLNSLSKYNDSLKFSSNFINNSLEIFEKELLEKICKSNEENIEWAGDITNLVAIYVKNEKYDKAIPLIKDNYKKIMEVYKLRKDMRYKLAQNWAKLIFLLEDSCIDKYAIAKELLEISIGDIENRRNVYHKEERATIGEISKSIYIMYIEIIFLTDSKIISEVDKYKILEQNIINICHKSTIEQKKYNQDKNIDDNLKKKETELQNLKEEYDILYKGNLGQSEELNNLGIKIQELQDYLKLNHPYYRPLPKLEKISFKDIKNSLKDKEIFFQYIKLNIISIQILITNKDIMVISKLLDTEKIHRSLNLVDKYIYGSNLNSEDSNIINDIEILSNQFASSVLEYCQHNQVSKIYVMPDLSLGSYNLNMSRLNDVCIIDKTTSIIQILDYSVLNEKKYIHNCSKFINRVFGNKNERNLKLIDNFIQRYKSDDFIIVDSDEDEIDTVRNSIIDKNADTVLIYGHGVDDPNGSDISGSLGIQGRRSLIHIENIVENMNIVKNIVLISCRGGVPLSKGIETSTGSWAELFETFRGNIIICKWDVNTESSIYIVEKLLVYVNKNIKLDEALLLSIKDAKKKYKDTIYWSGIEFWMN